MYANVETLASLPRVLGQKPDHGPARRHQIGAFSLCPRGLEQFNGLLAGLGRAQPLDCDQIVTAARDLIDADPAETVPACIAQRLAPATRLARLLADRDWTPSAGADLSLRQVLAYVRERNDLIPDWLPRVGRLDDAIVLDTAWELVGAEVFDYGDFCRLRELEAGHRGRDAAGFRFNRRDWLEARQAEVELQQQLRRVREGSYVPAAVAYFRVH